MWSVGDCDPLVETLGGTTLNIEYCEKLDQEHPVVVRMRRSTYDIQVTQRIAAEYPDEVGLLSQESQRVDVLLDKIGEWTRGWTDMEILKELQATTGLFRN